jgi:hypothetical protein
MTPNRLFYTFLIFASLAIIAIGMMKCCTPVNDLKLTAREDSVSNYIKQLEKQVGLSEAEAQKFHAEAVDAKNALKEYKPIYVYRTDSIIKMAPDTCYPYLLALKQQCDTMMTKYDSTIIKMGRVIKADSTVKEDYKRLVGGKDKLIAVKDSIKDSLLVVVAKFPKKLKRAKWQGRIEGGAAVQVANSIKNNLFKD